MRMIPSRRQRLWTIIAVCVCGACVAVAPYAVRPWKWVAIAVFVLPFGVIFWLIWRARKTTDRHVLLSIACVALALNSIASGDPMPGCLWLLIGLGWFWLAWNSNAPPLRAPRVKASELSGMMEYESMHFAGMRVEECSTDWRQQLSEVKTDGDGRFALPPLPGAGSLRSGLMARNPDAAPQGGTHAKRAAAAGPPEASLMWPIGVGS